jgi:type I restriction enzyme S subunit
VEGREYEPASVLLERILAERRRRWEEAELAKLKAKGTVPKNDNWKAKYVEPASPDMSELPELPEGWCWTTISAVTVFGPQNGIYVPQSFYGSGVPILRIDDFQAQCSRSSEELRQINISAQTASQYGLRADDIVINRVNSPSHLGKCLAVAGRHLPAVFESNMMRLGISGFVSPFFVQAYLSSDDGKKRLVSNAKWAVNQASINQGDVDSTPLPLPPVNEQNRVIAEVDRLLSSAAGISAGSQLSVVRCARLRQSILKWAFEGRLVDQDPSDEPAAVLLERIRAERAASHGRKQPRPRKVNTRSASA